MQSHWIPPGGFRRDSSRGSSLRRSCRFSAIHHDRGNGKALAGDAARLSFEIFCSFRDAQSLKGATARSAFVRHPTDEIDAAGVPLIPDVIYKLRFHFLADVFRLAKLHLDNRGIGDIFAEGVNTNVAIARKTGRPDLC
jgi:hypothetical protein